MIYSRKDLAVLAYTAGLLTGLIVAFAACTPDDAPHPTPPTGAHP